MDRYDFLRAILPPANGENYVSVFSTDKKVTWNRNYQSIEALADACVEASNSGLTAYFALGTFSDNVITKDDGKLKVQRQALQSKRFKTLAIDIDAGKVSDTPTYATTEEAAAALLKFIKDTSLPVPVVISSGHGLHAYWPLSEAVGREEWRALGVGLKALCVSHGLKIDPGKVHDPSMILRPLDTFNKGNLVRLVVKGAGPSVAKDLATKLHVSEDKLAKPLKVSATTSLNTLILASMEADYPPIDPTKIVERCAQLREATKDGGRSASYFQWFYALGTAKFSQDPIATATEWTKNHPEYSADTMQMKLDQYKADGPPGCSSFDNQIPGICGKCPHWQKISNPYRLGVPDPAPLTTSLPPPEAPDTPAAVPDFTIDPKHCAPVIEPPLPFKRTAAGVGFNDENGTWRSVCNYDVFPAHIVRDPSLGYSMVEWVWFKPHVGYTRMVIRTSAIFNDNSTVDLNNALADNGLLIDTKLKQSWMGQYMRAYTQLLQKHQASVDLYDSFGWKDNYNRFVLGSTEFRKDASGVSSHEVGVSKLISTKRFDETFSVKGDLGTWSTWTSVLDHPSLHTHQIELARAFMAPLIHFTGLRGMVFSLVGPSGRGKTTMQRWAASVYGIPDKVNTTANDTQMAMVQRMGVWGCLPMAVDEATLIKPEHLANLIYWGTQGQDRNRANETTQANTWALPLSLSTNRSLRDKASTVGADVDAIQMRMLEFEIPESPLFAAESNLGRRMYMMSGDNYGLAGRVYIPFLVSLGEARIKADIDAHMEFIAKKYDFQFEGKERFWQTAVVLCDLGCKYAKQLGLIKHNYENGTKAMLEQLGGQRVVLSGAMLDSYDMIADYLTQHNGAAITIEYRDGKSVPRLPYPRGEVRIRKELYAKGADNKPDRGFFYIDKTHFHHWLIGKGFDYKTVADVLQHDQSGFRPGKNGRIYMGKDSAITLPACAAIGLNMNHERFKGMLSQIDLTPDNIVDIHTAKGAK